jgi:hypothetical protein
MVDGQIVDIKSKAGKAVAVGGMEIAQGQLIHIAVEALEKVKPETKHSYRMI